MTAVADGCGEQVVFQLLRPIDGEIDAVRDISTGSDRLVKRGGQLIDIGRRQRDFVRDPITGNFSRFVLTDCRINRYDTERIGLQLL